MEPELDTPADFELPTPPELPPWRPKAVSQPSLPKRLRLAIGALFTRLFRTPTVVEADATAFQRFMGTAPAWLLSVIIHSATILILGLLAVQVHRNETREMDIEMAMPEDDLQDEIYAETLGQQLETPTPGVNEDEFTADSKAGYSFSDLPAVDDPLAAPSPSINPSADGLGLLSSVEAPSIGLALKGREKGYKEALLLAYGGTKTTKESVELALAWLSRQQGRDGLWSLRGPYSDGAGSENKPAATAMALLAYLGDGRTHMGQDPFHRNVQRGLTALLKIQGDDGSFAIDGIPMNHRLYTHAQCTIVLCELYAITQDSMLLDPVQKAVDYCVSSQSPLGGWRYHPNDDADTSVTGWFVMALQSARMARLEVPSPCLQNAGDFLDKVASHGGSRYAYQPGRANTPAMTAEALLCRQYLGWRHDDERLVKGVNFLRDHPVEWKSRNVYYWYYATQVMHHMGGEQWVEWNRVMRQVVPENQVRAGKDRGSWDPGDDPWGRSAGRLFQTCLSTYMLEVYYRHLPLYTLGTDQAKQPEPSDSASAAPAAGAPASIAPAGGKSRRPATTRNALAAEMR